MVSILKVTLSLGVFILGLDRFLKGVTGRCPSVGITFDYLCSGYVLVGKSNSYLSGLSAILMIFLTVIAIAAAIFLNQTIYGRYLLALATTKRQD